MTLRPLAGPWACAAGPRVMALVHFPPGDQLTPSIPAGCSPSTELPLLTADHEVALSSMWPAPDRWTLSFGDLAPSVGLIAFLHEATLELESPCPASRELRGQLLRGLCPRRGEAAGDSCLPKPHVPSRRKVCTLIAPLNLPQTLPPFWGQSTKRESLGGSALLPTSLFLSAVSWVQTRVDASLTLHTSHPLPLSSVQDSWTGSGKAGSQDPGPGYSVHQKWKNTSFLPLASLRSRSQAPPERWRL